eukprot:3407201-Amphidinium_carterae.1
MITAMHEQQQQQKSDAKDEASKPRRKMIKKRTGSEVAASPTGQQRPNRLSKEFEMLGNQPESPQRASMPVSPSET